MALFAVPLAWGGDSPIIRVEEEWALTVGTPDVASNSPQVVCAMTPFGSLGGLYMTFEINHRSDPEYVSGGLNMLVWSGEQRLVTKSGTNLRDLDAAGEQIYWTQAMEVGEGQLTFEIIRGHSTTWGEFGCEGSLRASVATSLSDLSSYTPGVSVKHSGVTFASGCVNKLTLKSIRYYRADGTVQVDATPRVVAE
ncbi:MAG: hypothetical protein ACYC3X_12750 [Pirellulaceae bacterium]